MRSRRGWAPCHPARLACLWMLLAFAVWPAEASCPHACSQRGTCTNEVACTCFAGFTGADCSQRKGIAMIIYLLCVCDGGARAPPVPAGVCASAPAWLSKTSTASAHPPMECSNNGLCNRATGECECFPGFGGEACARGGSATVPVLPGRRMSSPACLLVVFHYPSSPSALPK